MIDGSGVFATLSSDQSHWTVLVISQPEPRLARFYVAIWHHNAAVSKWRVCFTAWEKLGTDGSVITKFMVIYITQQQIRQGFFNDIQSSAVITLSNLSRYYKRHGDSSIKKWIRYQNHNRHPEIWGVYYEDCGENWPRYNGTALYSI